MAMSSCEAKYIAATTVSTQALWLARLLGDFLGRDTGAVELVNNLRIDSNYPVPKDYYIHIDSGLGLMGLNTPPQTQGGNGGSERSLNK
jgi:hypothetical protein